MRWPSIRLAVLVGIVALAAGAPASAEYPQGVVPEWPELLPPQPNDSRARIGIGFDVCPRGQLACTRSSIREMKALWRPLDRSCDHRAIFALTYLRTTQEFYRTARDHPAFFSDPEWVNYEGAVFAEQYFRPYDRYEAGLRVPAAWRIAFETARSPNETGFGDLLLGVNAHINRDLPYALAHVGLVKPDGSSRKRDHDRVNLFLDRVIDPLQAELARRYDPLFRTIDAEPSPLDEAAGLHLIRTARENAWRNAERLVNARTKAQRRQVKRSIELESRAVALAVKAANTLPGYGRTRDAYCRAAHSG